jgi:uncharacterized membrane protein
LRERALKKAAIFANNNNNREIKNRNKNESKGALLKQIKKNHVFAIRIGIFFVFMVSSCI